MDARSILFVALGSALGGGLRYVTIYVIDRKSVGAFPLSVLVVNAVGSFIIGFVIPYYGRHGWDRDDVLPLILSVGVLGGYTTFSTFSLQTLRLLQSSQFGLATLYAGASFLVCLGSVYFGLKLGQAIWGAP